MPKDRKDGWRQENRMANRLDLLAEFEEFQDSVIPRLKGLLKDDKYSAEELRNAFHKDIAAVQVAAALRERDPAKAASIAGQILDRIEGKPKEKKELTHKLEKLSDDQLDAVLRSELQDVSDEE